MRYRKPNRLKPYDYSLPGYYFVTICIDKMKCVFGEIENGRMKLNEYGKIVEKYLKVIPDKYHNFELDYFVVMPNHVHAIIIINNVGETYESSLQ